MSQGELGAAGLVVARFSRWVGRNYDAVITLAVVAVALTMRTLGLLGDSWIGQVILGVLALLAYTIMRERGRAQANQGDTAPLRARGRRIPVTVAPYLGAVIAQFTRWVGRYYDTVITLAVAAVALTLRTLGLLGSSQIDQVILVVLALLAYTIVRERARAQPDELDTPPLHVLDGGIPAAVQHLGAVMARFTRWLRRNYDAMTTLAVAAVALTLRTLDVLDAYQITAAILSLLALLAYTIVRERGRAEPDGRESAPLRLRGRAIPVAVANLSVVARSTDLDGARHFRVSRMPEERGAGTLGMVRFTRWLRSEYDAVITLTVAASALALRMLYLLSASQVDAVILVVLALLAYTIVRERCREQTADRGLAQVQVGARMLGCLARALPAHERVRFVEEEKGNLGDCQRWWRRVDHLVGLTIGMPRLAWMMRREGRGRPA